MNYTIRPLVESDLVIASHLDRQWFGDNAISVKDLKLLLLRYPNENVGIVSDSKLVGFATFEILSNRPPRDYISSLSMKEKVMFIHQFTTDTNYNITSWVTDEKLLEGLEIKATELGCSEVWEALSVNHPYRKTINAQFDAFGFYMSKGYKADKEHPLTWSPSGSDISIPCVLFRKKLLNSG